MFWELFSWKISFQLHEIITVSGSTPTPWSDPFRDHGLRPWSQSLSEHRKPLEIKGFLGLERPFLDLVSQTPRPRGGGRPLFAEIIFSEFNFARISGWSVASFTLGIHLRTGACTQPFRSCSGMVMRPCRHGEAASARSVCKQAHIVSR